MRLYQKKITIIGFVVFCFLETISAVATTHPLVRSRIKKYYALGLSAKEIAVQMNSNNEAINYQGSKIKISEETVIGVIKSEKSKDRSQSLEKNHIHGRKGILVILLKRYFNNEIVGEDIPLFHASTTIKQSTLKVLMNEEDFAVLQKIGILYIYGMHTQEIRDSIQWVTESKINRVLTIIFSLYQSRISEDNRERNRIDLSLRIAENKLNRVDQVIIAILSVNVRKKLEEKGSEFIVLKNFEQLQKEKKATQEKAAETVGAKRTTLLMRRKALRAQGCGGIF